MNAATPPELWNSFTSAVPFGYTFAIIGVIDAISSISSIVILKPPASAIAIK